MGKGDQKSKRGKIIAGTYGVSRKKRKKKAIIPVKTDTAVKEKKEKPVKVIKEDIAAIAEIVADIIEPVETAEVTTDTSAEGSEKKKTAKAPKKTKTNEPELNLEGETEVTPEETPEAPAEA